MSPISTVSKKLKVANVRDRLYRLHTGDVKNCSDFNPPERYRVKMFPMNMPCQGGMCTLLAHLKEKKSVPSSGSMKLI